mgnify:CR=1 FL=1
MRKLTILSATLLSSALILSACSSASEKKEETVAPKWLKKRPALQSISFQAQDAN